MSSQTPNLNLVLPVGTEKVSRQIINDNNTKIDTAVGLNSQAIAKLCIKGSLTAITANGTGSDITCTGLTANHKVVNWGLFSDSEATTPIDPNNPPADITIVEKADAYAITIANYSSAFYIQPTFILPQN